MKLLTKEITKKAIGQYPLGSDMKQDVVAKFFYPAGTWTWYLMNLDPEDMDYCWGIVKGDEVETGSFSILELTEYRGQFGLGIERDKFFKPRPAEGIYQDLLDGKHV